MSILPLASWTCNWRGTLKENYKRILLISAFFITCGVVGYLIAPTEEIEPWYGQGKTSFSGGANDSSDITVTHAFHVLEEPWSVRLSRFDLHKITAHFGEWSLKVEIYEVVTDELLRSVHISCYLGGCGWHMPQEGSASLTIYYPDLPSGNYYLKIYWERLTWTIEIFEEP